MSTLRAHPYRPDVAIDFDGALAELHLVLDRSGIDPDKVTDADLYEAIGCAAQTFAAHDPRVTDAERALQYCAQLRRPTRVAADGALDINDRAAWSIDRHAQEIVRVCLERAVADLLTAKCFQPDY